MRPTVLISAWSQLLLPTTCVGCGRAGTGLCARCGALVPVRDDVGGLTVVAAGHYCGALRAAVIAYKERGRHELARRLGDLLAASVELSASPSAAALVPVPSTRSAARRRGGDHVQRLARRAGRLVDRPVLVALSHRRAVLDASGLSAAERATNLQGAMSALPPSPAITEAVIVDDVLTTGATVREAARALASAGWRVRGAAVLARTPYRVQGRSAGASSSGTA